MAKRSLAGKRVIVTGASSGIGLALSRKLAERQCKIVINARRIENLKQLAAEIKELGGEATVVPGDVTDPLVRQSIIDASLRDFNGLDVLINNAGIGALGRFAEASEARLRRVMEVNFFAPAELTRLAIPALTSSKNSVVVNISSILGHRGVTMKSEYCASKFALHGLSDAIRCELVDCGIDVLLVSPSTTESEFFDNVIGRSTGKNWKLSTAKSPDYVARRTLKALEKGKHEIILSWSGWGLVILDRLMPTLANRIVERFGK